MYFDTHAHYDDEAFDGDRDEVLASMPGRGISLIVNPGCDLASSRTAVKLAERYSFVYAAAGIHPHEAEAAAPGDMEAVARLTEHPRVVAVGEIGLDYYYDYSPREAQKRVLRAQMELAASADLPVIIHDRDAHEDCLNIVREFKNVRGVYHCYSGSLEEAKVLIRLGWYLSFTGAVTFKNARKAHEVIRWMPEDRIMLETDSPYLTPVPHRGKRNDSGYLPLVAELVAELRGISAERTAEITLENGKRFFGIA